MITSEEYGRYDATGLAGLVANSDVTAADLVECAISQIEEFNPALNAVVAPMFDTARDEVASSEPSGPFGGVPYLVKDLNTWVDGIPATNGSRAFEAFLPPGDCVLVSRLRSGGLILVGKTNTPEFGLNVDTSPELFGPTRNPYDPGRSAGGSSGGSACAVAAGMVPAAHATDSGGSIRIPASNCGLFGLKPSRARVPLGNDAAEGLGGLSTGHAVTHSVRDSALLLDITAGPMPGDAYVAPYVSLPFSQALSGPMPDLRVALWNEGFAGEGIAGECKEAASNAAQLCEDIGCRVDEVRPPVDGEGLRAAFEVLFSANIHNAVQAAAAANPGKEVEELVEAVTFACSQAGEQHSAPVYAAALQVGQAAARALGQFFEDYDVLLTPTLANPPLALGALPTSGDDWLAYCDRMLDEIPFTPLFNATGGPAASVPLGRDSSGLPIGVQFGTRLGGEATLLRLGRELELAAPWHHRI